MRLSHCNHVSNIAGTMADSPKAARQRAAGKDKKPASYPLRDVNTNGAVDALAQKGAAIKDSAAEKGAAIKESATREWDYKLAFGIITILAFLTRFWGISHPNQVVFDEVHFGKVSKRYTEQSGQKQGCF